MTFDTTILQSKETFTDYYSQERKNTVSAVIDKTQKKRVEKCCLYKVKKIAQLAFHKFVHIFCRFLYSLKRSKKLYIELYHRDSRIDFIWNKHFSRDKNKLTTAINMHRKDTENYYNSNDLKPEDSIIDKGVRFFRDCGMCRGASDWFISLYLQAKEENPDIDTEKLVVALGNRFKYGLRSAPALLQNVLSSNLRKAATNVHYSGVDLHLTENRDENLINQLEDGIFMVQFATHACVLIKDKKNYYFFDINEGVSKFVSFGQLFDRSLHPYMKDDSNSIFQSVKKLAQDKPAAEECYRKLRTSNWNRDGFSEITSDLSPFDKELFEIWQTYIKPLVFMRAERVESD